MHLLPVKNDSTLVLLQPYYAHHGEVVVGVGTVAMTIYFLGQCLNDLFCRTEMCLSKDV